MLSSTIDAVSFEDNFWLSDLMKKAFTLIAA